MRQRPFTICTVVVMIGALLAPGVAGADPTIGPTADPTPGQATPPQVLPPGITPTFTTQVTDSCPYRDVAPPPVDESEVPVPGQPSPAPLPVPTPPIGGHKLAGCGLVLPDAAPPVPQGIDSAGWLIADLQHGTVISAKDPHGRYRPASTLKLLLIQVALRELNLDAVVEGTESDDAQEGDAAGIAPGGRYTVRELLTALMLISGNDAAYAIARELGGTEAAVAKMNQLAQSLGALDTRAATPSGLDGPGQTSSPYDLALILQSALRDPRFVQIASTTEMVFPGHPPVPTTPPSTTTTQPPAVPGVPTSAPAPPPPPPTSQPPYPLYNENQLLTEVPGAVAGKTGYTDDARKTFVGAVDRDGHRYVIVQMYGFAYTGNTYWDQYRRLLDYAVALGDSSVGVLDGRPAAETTSGSIPEPTESTSKTNASGSAESGLSNPTRIAIGVGGAALVLALVAAAWALSRRSRSRR